jgi:peptidoglycan/xylan/chitin deacetylase (PgdA/CDA1 family)
MWREIAGCQRTLSDILNEPPVWFRPPVGHHNVFTAMPVRVLGLTMLVWNCRGFDGVYRNVPGILRRLARGLRPGAIVLLHDATPIAADVLEGALDLIRRRGLRPALPEKARL